MNLVSRLRVTALAAVLAAVLAAPLSATVVYDLGSAVLDGGAGANTFARGATSLAFSGDNLNFQLGANSYLVGYFDAVTLGNVGDKLSLSFTYTAPVDAFATADQAFRVGLFDSKGTQITQNGGTSNNAFNDERGAGVMLRARAGTLGSSNAFYERKADGSGTTLWSTALYTAIPGTPTLGQVVTGGTTITYGIERLAEGALLYTVSYTGPSGSVSESIISAAPATYTFDTLSIFANPVSATTPTLSFSDITVTSIPEPASAAALIGLGALGLVASRRRRR